MVKFQIYFSDQAVHKHEVYHDKACPQYKSWCEGHNKDTEESPLMDETNTVVKKTLTRNDSVCSCGPSQNIPPLTKDGQVTTDSESILTSKMETIQDTECVKESNTVRGSNNIDSQNGGNVKRDSGMEFGDFVSADDHFLNADGENVQETDSSQVEFPSNNHAEKPKLSGISTIDLKPVVDHRDKSNDKITMSEDAVDDCGNKTKEELRIGNIVYLPVSEDDKGVVSVQEFESAKKTLQKMSLHEFDQKTRSYSSPIEIQSSKQTSSSPELKSSGSFGSFNVTPHLNAFVNYATGLFKSSDVKDIAEVEKQSSVDFARPGGIDNLQGGPRKGNSSSFVMHSQENKDLELAVENAVKLADKPELFQSFDSEYNVIVALIRVLFIGCPMKVAK